MNIALLKKDLYQFRFAIIAIFLYFIFTQLLFGTVCPFRILFNFPCPACGLTHASIALLCGNFIQAFQYNITVVFWWILIILFIIDRYFYKLKFKVFPTLFIIVGILTLLLYVIRISSYIVWLNTKDYFAYFFMWKIFFILFIILANIDFLYGIIAVSFAICSSTFFVSCFCFLKILSGLYFFLSSSWNIFSL